jgi:hypothetical protein
MSALFKRRRPIPRAEVEPGLVKVSVDLHDDDGPATESFWAEPLGGDLYRLRNTPFYAFDLNFLDVVRAVSQEPDAVPTVVSVQRRSGHKTLRVLFAETTSESNVNAALGRLNDAAVNHERAWGRFYALDVRPEADYPAICTWLWELEEAGRLHYEKGATTDDQ